MFFWNGKCHLGHKCHFSHRCVWFFLVNFLFNFQFPVLVFLFINWHFFRSDFLFFPMYFYWVFVIPTLTTNKDPHRSITGTLQCIVHSSLSWICKVLCESLPSCFKMLESVIQNMSDHHHLGSVLHYYKTILNKTLFCCVGFFKVFRMSTIECV